MQGHERNLSAFVVLVGVADERGMVQKLVEHLSAIAGVHGSIYQFAQILDAGVGLGRVFVLELLDVAGAVDQEFEEFRGGCGLARSAETLNTFVICSAGTLSAVAEDALRPAGGARLLLVRRRDGGATV